MVAWVSLSLTFMAIFSVVIDNATMNALFYREAKLFLMSFTSNTTLEKPDLIDCDICY